MQLPVSLTIESAAGTLNRMSQAVLGGTDGVVVVDAGPLESFDTAAVAVLLELRRRLAKTNRGLAVVNQPEHLVDLIRLYGVGELLAA